MNPEMPALENKKKRIVYLADSYQNVTPVKILDADYLALQAVLQVKGISVERYLKNSEIFFNEGYKAIIHGERVVHIALGYYQVKRVSEKIGMLSELKTLNLYVNKLENIPESIGELTSLTSLNLSGNYLSNLPESFGKLQSLQHLDLVQNQLSALPESVGGLGQLRYLGLLRNQLSHLPESICMLTKLEQLDLRQNPIRELPAFLADLPLVFVYVDPGVIVPDSLAGRCSVYHDHD